MISSEKDLTGIDRMEGDLSDVAEKREHLNHQWLLADETDDEIDRREHYLFLPASNDPSTNKRESNPANCCKDISEMFSQ